MLTVTLLCNAEFDSHPPGFEPRSDGFGDRYVADYTRDAGRIRLPAKNYAQANASCEVNEAFVSDNWQLVAHYVYEIIRVRFWSLRSSCAARSSLVTGERSLFV